MPSWIIAFKIRLQSDRFCTNLYKHATAKMSVIAGPYQSQNLGRCLEPHVTTPPQFLCHYACFLCTMLALFSRIPVSGCRRSLSSFATMGSFLILLRPPSPRFPLRACRQAFLSTHSIRPLSFAVIHYCRRRSVSCAAARMQNNATISTDVILRNAPIQLICIHRKLRLFFFFLRSDWFMASYRELV